MQEIKAFARAALAVIILGSITAVLLSSWRSDSPILGFLSYQAVEHAILETDPAAATEHVGTANSHSPLWLHCIYLSIFLGVEILAFHGLHTLLKRILPIRPKTID